MLGKYIGPRGHPLVLLVKFHVECTQNHVWGLRKTFTIISFDGSRARPGGVIYIPYIRLKVSICRAATHPLKECMGPAEPLSDRSLTLTDLFERFLDIARALSQSFQC